jgi:hypothetical protein
MAVYASAASLALFLARALTAAETASASAACAAATEYVDRFTGKTWQGQTITGELQTVPYNGIVRLDRLPVASLTTVTARWLYVGETIISLVANTDYELIDALNGLVLVNRPQGTVLTVTYVTGSTVPADIALAANIIAASYLISAPAASLKPRGIQKLKAGSAEITYDPIDRSMPIPPTAYALLAAYRPAFSFA